MKVGLYAWHEITTLPSEVQWLRLSYARIGGGMSDAVMAFCAEHNVEVLLNITPAAERSQFADDAGFIAAYLSQLDNELGRYGPRGTFWVAGSPSSKAISQVEICNEPNFGYGFNGPRTEMPALYANLLIAAYDHIKASWPSVTVVGFATGGASNAAPGFVSDALTALQAAGRLDCFDVMSLHPYSSDQPPEEPITETWGTWVASQSMETIRQLMMDFGVDKPLWITEVGYQISYADGGRFANPSRTSSGRPETVTPTQQAAYTIRMNMAAARHDISRVYHMSALDTDNFNSGWFGTSHDPRPVATAMRQVIQLLSGATYLDVVLDGGIGSPESPFAYRFTTPRGMVMVAWCQIPGSFKLPIDSETETRVVDMLGNTVATVTDSSYVAALSESPIFLFPSSSVG